MKTVEQQMVVMKAYADGKTIKRTARFFPKNVEEFDRETSPMHFNWQDYDCDIVEEPIVKYMIITQSGGTVCDYPSHESAKAKLKYFHCEGYKIIKLVQDMDFKGDEE